MEKARLSSGNLTYLLFFRTRAVHWLFMLWADCSVDNNSHTVRHLTLC